MKIHSCLIALLFLFSPSISFAGAPDYTIQQEYTSTRALGMGNAFIALADDHSAVFYNPAALEFREEGHLRMFVRAGIDDEYLDFIDELDGAEDDVQETANIITNRYGEHRYARVTVGGVWARPGWGIALLPADLSTDIAINRLIGPALGVTAYLDTTLAFSYADDTKWVKKKYGKLAWGATVKAIHRAYYNDAIDAGTLVVEDDIFKIEKAEEGMTVDLDIGLMWKPKFKKKSFFVVMCQMINT